MVAVPRSKGCVTCRNRRVKCDETKPVCKKCTNAGIQCGGFHRDAIFRNLSTAPLPPSPPRPSKEIVVLSVPPSLDLKAFKDNICGAYLFQNFVWRTYGTPWLEMAAQGRLDSLSLETTRALALSYFGKNHHQSKLQVEGGVCYGKSLQQVIAALSPSGHDNPETLIVPILVLLLYSSALGDRAGSVSHVRGLMMLLSSCGPSRFQTRVLLSALESARATLITTSLITKTRTFLAQQHWQEGPWSAGQQPKGNQSQLMDIMVMIPGLLADLKSLGSGDSSLNYIDLLDRTCDQLDALFRWRWAWELKYSGQVWSQPSPESPERPRVFDHELQFQSLSLVSDIMLYNAVLLWLLGVLGKITPDTVNYVVQEAAMRTKAFAGFSIGHLPGEASLKCPGEATTLHDAAVEICQTLAYHIRHIAQSQDSSLFYLFPIGMAWGILKDDPGADYQQWIMEILNSSDVTKDYFTDGYQWLWKLQTNSFHQMRSVPAKQFYDLC